MPQVPARRYDIFIKAFEKEVHEAQLRIKKMDRLMKPYELVREALERFRMPNTHDLRLDATEVVVIIVPTDDDHWNAFDPLLEDIGKGLAGAKLHSSGVPSVDHEFGLDWNYRWRLIIADGTVSTVRVRIDVPYSGTRYIKVTETKEARVDSIYKARWLSKHEVTQHGKET